MSTPLSLNEMSFKRSHKPSCTESDLTTEDSLMSNFQSLRIDDNYASNHSLILKQNFSSVNSNNVTFGDFINHDHQKQKENNLAYAICKKFPPKIKKQVHSIIQYYEGQLEGQRQMFWRTTETKNRCKKNQDFSFNLECQKIVDSSQKDDRINELENRLIQKDEKIIELNKEITKLMTNYTRLKKQVGSSPLKSSRTLNREDSIKEFQ